MPLMVAMVGKIEILLRASASAAAMVRLALLLSVLKTLGARKCARDLHGCNPSYLPHNLPQIPISSSTGAAATKTNLSNTASMMSGFSTPRRRMSRRPIYMQSPHRQPSPFLTPSRLSRAVHLASQSSGTHRHLGRSESSRITRKNKTNQRKRV